MNVRPGQVWQDNDPRQGGRRVTVEKVYGGFAHVNSGKARSRIHLGALPKRFTLVQEIDRDVALRVASEEVIAAAREWKKANFARWEEVELALSAAVDRLVALESEGA